MTLLSAHSTCHKIVSRPQKKKIELLTSAKILCRNLFGLMMTGGGSWSWPRLESPSFEGEARMLMTLPRAFRGLDLSSLGLSCGAARLKLRFSMKISLASFHREAAPASEMTHARQFAQTCCTRAKSSTERCLQMMDKIWTIPILLRSPIKSTLSSPSYMPRK